MIVGIGNDIIEISRVKKAVQKEHFMKRFFTQIEIDYAKSKKNPYETFAGIFCAKESIFKALGTGFSGQKFQSVEILHEKSGKPYVKDRNILLTISHCKEYAVATAIIIER